MERLANLCFIILVGLILLLLLTFSLLTPAEAYSEYENRDLAQSPTHADIADGSYPANFEAYLTDQFAFRQQFVGLFTQLQLRLGKTYVRDLYVNEPWLITKDAHKDEDAVCAAAANLNRLAEYLAAAGRPLYYCNVPQKTDTFSYMLPYAGMSHPENLALFRSQLSDQVIYVDAAEQIMQLPPEQKQQLFFRTDYHWNGRGAFQAFALLMAAMQANGALDEDDFDPADYEEHLLPGKHYLGDLNRRLGYAIDYEEEIVYVDAIHRLDLAYQLLGDDGLYDVAEDEVFASGIAKDEVTYNDVYTWNLDYIRITNQASTSDKSVLVIKDSMQNATTRNFASIFAQVEIIDLRLLSADDFAQLLNASEADYVVVMYNSANLNGRMFEFGV